MGVHGLWDLLSPVGRRVSVETLAGKRLAIDASIWMIQFMKAMRDEKGEMVRNAHLLGFFRRICKLLFLRTKPVFVFDGGTPALKRRTVIARRRQRENAQAKIRKTAEKLLLNQLKQIRLKELADELEKQKRSINVAKGKNIITDEADIVDKTSGGSKLFGDNCNQEAVDEMLAASLAVEEDELAADLERQKRSVCVAKGKRIVTEEAGMVDKTSGGTKLFADNCNQEAVDEMLAASLAAEEDGGFTVGESSSSVQIEAEEEDADEDEEIILPTMQGKLDPAILAALPPSMQLDLLVQMRERLMAENRQKYQRVKKVPARFSELQIQAYLKTVAFRREIDEVQKAAAGKGLGGVQTSRIASEANREFIFSANYSGDKLDLTATGEGRKDSDQSRAPLKNPSGGAVNVASAEKCSAVAGSPVDEPQRVLENDVETYLDERGRVRVSRVRAMGIRMTRDIQRNLDLMKEIEEEGVGMTQNLRNQQTGSAATQGNAPGGIQISQVSDQDPHGNISENVNSEETVLDAGTSIEITFEDTGQHELGGEDDDLFTQLVAGFPVIDFSVDNSLSKKQFLDSTSEPEWEEGIIECEGGALSKDIELEGKVLREDGMSSEQELEWEEGEVGSLNIQEESSSCPSEYKKGVSKGALEEEADIQEAIRRSLEDLEDRKSDNESNQGEESKTAVEIVTGGADAEFVNGEGDWRDGSSIPHHDSPCEVKENSMTVDGLMRRKIPETNNSLVVQGTANLGVSFGKVEVFPVELHESDPGLEVFNYNVGRKRSSEREMHELGTSVQENNAGKAQLTYASCSDGFGATIDSHFKQATETERPSEKDTLKDINIAQELAEEEVREYLSNKGEEPLDKVGSSGCRMEDIRAKEASLEEEMLILGEEFEELGYKQRKLERNAESVSSEMFTECQELLQIFGLPYIIAPMEAEAQCAYMELVDLVDGVVTDDSDTFLFGARNVYKNIFDDRKYVETYFMKDIENELGLNREKLIRMALLLGSDYTEGISGIGIVNAIEVVNAFSEEDGLNKFREWIESPDPSILGKLDAQGSTKRRESQVGDMESCSDSKLNTVSASDGPVSGSTEDVQKIKQIFMDKHRNVSKNWHIPSSFPSEAVILAYDSPQVDKSTEPFQWGKPDHFVLRKLCWEKFGWSTQRADELLLPVLREYNKREMQLRLEAFYYTFNERFAKIRSKRIKKAVKGITGNKSLDLAEESVLHGSRKKKVRRVNQDDAAEAKSEEASRGKEYADASNEASITGKLNEKKLKKRGAHGEAQLAVGNKNALPIQEENCQSGRKGTNVKRGSGGDTGRERYIKKARKTYQFSKSAVSCSDDSSNEGEQDSQVGPRDPGPVRRSGRPRKEVNYTISDMDFDDPEDDGKSCNENAATEEPFSDIPEAGYSDTVPSEIKDMEHTDPVSAEECIGMGGSFSLDKAKEDKGTDSQTADFLSENLLSEEYLTMGGGFCLDEDDGTDGKMPGSSTCSTRGTICNPDSPNCSDLGEDENTARPTRTMNSSKDVGRIGKEDASDTNQNSHDNDYNGNHLENNTNEDDFGKGSLRSLRAMPNLKRKRRKF